MNKLRGTAIAILAAGALACAALAMAQARESAPTVPHDPMVFQAPSAVRTTGVNVVRLINTAEAEYKGAHGGYASWPELYRGYHREARKGGPDVWQPESEPGP